MYVCRHMYVCVCTWVHAWITHYWQNLALPLSPPVVLPLQQASSTHDQSGMHSVSGFPYPSGSAPGPNEPWTSQEGPCGRIEQGCVGVLRDVRCLCRTQPIPSQRWHYEQRWCPSRVRTCWVCPECWVEGLRWIGAPAQEELLSVWQAHHNVAETKKGGEKWREREKMKERRVTMANVIIQYLQNEIVCWLTYCLH